VEDLQEETPRDGIEGASDVQLKHHPRLLLSVQESSGLLDQHKVIMDATRTCMVDCDSMYYVVSEKIEQL
jgi:hypothetical protein